MHCLGRHDRCTVAPIAARNALWETCTVPASYLMTWSIQQKYVTTRDIATNPRSDKLKSGTDLAHQALAQSNLGCMSYQLQLLQLMRHDFTRVFDL